jgi:hypothetical protein
VAVVVVATEETTARLEVLVVVVELQLLHH